MENIEYPFEFIPATEDDVWTGEGMVKMRVSILNTYDDSGDAPERSVATEAK